MKNARWWDLPAAALLLAVILTSAGRLGITGWTPNLYFAQTMGVLGSILGLALGLSRFSRRPVLAIAAGYTIVLVPWQLSVAIDSKVSLAVRLQIMAGRLLASLSAFFQRQPVEDVLFFIAFVTLGYWLIGLTAGYWLTRHTNYLVAIIPAGLVMIFAQVYDQENPARIWFLALYSFLALLLMGRLYYVRNRAAWQEQRFFLSPGSGRDIFNGLLVTAAVVILLAWTLPASRSSLEAATTYWNRLSQPWTALRDRISNAFSGLKGSAGSGSGDFYGDQMALGTRGPVSDAVVFTVQIPITENQPPRYYWLGRVYDYYQDGQWSSPGLLTETFSPEQGNIALIDFNLGNITQFTFTSHLSQQTLLYTVPQTLWVSRPSDVVVFIVDSNQKDPLAWRASPTLHNGDTYRVRAAAINPTIAELVSAGSDYPAWVTDKYLQLTAELSPRIRQLAEQITVGLSTPYDKAVAITTYLRREIQYSSSIPSPTGSIDPIEWVLFDLKKGFCNYYATAEVLMLRSLGIPARMAVGFAQGEYDPVSNKYTVLWRDAHAWPEVYFPGTGWVAFEPTSNQPPLNRPQGQPTETGSFLPGATSPIPSTPSGDFTNGGKNVDESGVSGTSPSVLLTRWIFLVSITLVLVTLLWVLDMRYALMRHLPVHLKTFIERNDQDAPVWMRRWAAWSQLTPLARSFEAVNWSLRRMEEPPEVHATPAERARKLTRLLPEAASAIEVLTAQHQASLYTPHPGNTKHARQASLTILYLTVRAVLRRWWKPFENHYSA